MSRRVALVTGGTRGIGLGVARALAREGFSLALCGRRPEAEVARVLEELRGLTPSVFYAQADIAVAAEREWLIAAVRSQYARLHVLVNNAGIAPAVRADLLDAGVESYEQVLRTNLEGPHFLTQLAARFMIEQRQSGACGWGLGADWTGCVVFVTSVSASVVSTNRGEYCLSKAALAMSSRLWAVRLAEHGIPVYDVRPGIVRTEMTAGVAEKYERMIGEGLLPQARWGEPEDVGRVVAALARGDAPYSTGAVIPVDGGLTIPRL